LPRGILVVHLCIERPDSLDQAAQMLEVGFAADDYLVRHDAVESFLGWFGKKSFGHSQVFFGGETQAIDEALHFRFGGFNTLANPYFLLAREEGHSADLFEEQLDRVVEGIESAVFLCFGLGEPGLLGVGLVHNLDVEVAELGIKHG
jgi:hypothetical protein